jgi:hypothetical protein
MIPVKFVMEFGNELFDVTILTDLNGHLWQVGLEKENKDFFFLFFEKENKEIWFDDGWQ